MKSDGDEVQRERGDLESEHIMHLSLAWERAQRERHRFVAVVFDCARYASDTASRYASDTTRRYASDTTRNTTRVSAAVRAAQLFTRDSLRSLLPPGEVLELGVSPQSPLKRLWPDRSRVTLSWSSARARLGSSEAALLIELDEGVQPDALAAALGVIVGGGIVLICAPTLPPAAGSLKRQLTAWPHAMNAVTHHFWSRLWRALCEFPGSRELTAGLWCSHASHSDHSGDQEAISPAPDLSSLHPKNKNDHQHTYALLKPETRLIIDECTLNAEQREAVLTALNALRREAFCAVALCALRGRGKSSALGVIAAALSLEGEAEVVITAPSLYAVGGVFARARESLELSGYTMRSEPERLVSALGVIRYHQPQMLWRREVKPSAILVDEAAALPVPLLERLLEGRPKIVFATTTQGYEGAGRGFSLRFRPQLQRRVRKLYEPRLTSPLRWGEGDPLEAWMMSALMLNVDVHLSVRDLDLSRYHHHEITRDELADDHELLREIFGLLVHAHYQTQPSDLWRILDAPQLTLHALRDLTPPSQCPRVIAVVLLSLEGGLSPERAAELYEGRVRARGQLFAANLSLHLNSEEGATLKLVRVVRIATLPTQQGRGGGSRLLEEVTVMMRERGIDLIGSSFGSTARLARFWLRADFTPLRVGVKQNHTSGERSLLVARALSGRGEQTLEQLTAEALIDLPHQLLGPLAQLDPELAQLILIELYKRIYTQGERLSESNSQFASELTSELTMTLTTLPKRSWRALGAVIYGGRAYELALEPARQLTLIWLRRLAYQTHSEVSEGHSEEHPGEYQRLIPERLIPEEYQSFIKLTALGELLIMKTLQRRRWLEVSAELGVSTSEAMRGLGVALELLFERLAPPWASAWCERFGARGAEQRLCAQLLPRSLTDHS